MWRERFPLRVRMEEKEPGLHNEWGRHSTQEKQPPCRPGNVKDLGLFNKLEVIVLWLRNEGLWFRIG